MLNQVQNDEKEWTLVLSSGWCHWDNNYQYILEKEMIACEEKYRSARTASRRQ